MPNQSSDLILTISQVLGGNYSLFLLISLKLACLFFLFFFFLAFNSDCLIYILVSVPTCSPHKLRQEQLKYSTDVQRKYSLGQTSFWSQRANLFIWKPGYQERRGEEKKERRRETERGIQRERSALHWFTSQTEARSCEFHPGLHMSTPQVIF